MSWLVAEHPVGGDDLQLRLRLVQVIEKTNGEIGDALEFVTAEPILHEGRQLDRHAAS